MCLLCHVVRPAVHTSARTLMTSLMTPLKLASLKIMSKTRLPCGNCPMAAFHCGIGICRPVSARAAVACLRKHPRQPADASPGGLLCPTVQCVHLGSCQLCLQCRRWKSDLRHLHHPQPGLEISKSARNAQHARSTKHAWWADDGQAKPFRHGARYHALQHNAPSRKVAACTHNSDAGQYTP